MAKEVEYPDLLHLAIRSETRARLDQYRGLTPTSIFVRCIIDEWFTRRGFPPLEPALTQYAVPQYAPPQYQPPPPPPTPTTQHQSPMNGTAQHAR